VDKQAKIQNTLTVTLQPASEVLTQAEQVRVFGVWHDRPRDRVLVAPALGAGLRSSELTGVKVGNAYRSTLPRWCMSRSSLTSCGATTA
jgi:hypothetical protein